MVQATEEERAAIRAMLSRRAEFAPAEAAAGRAPALAWAGLRLAAAVLLAAGVVAGYADGDEFDDVGCTVAQQPGGTSHGARSAQARERPGGKLPGSEGGSAGGSGDGGPCRGKAETLQAETFPIKLLRRILDSTLEQQAAIERILDGQALAECQQRPPLAEGAGQGAPPEPSQRDEPSLSRAVKLFELLTALDPDSRLRKAPPIKVFLLHFRQNVSRSQVARVCGCSRTRIAERLRSIREKLPWRPHQLRELSAHVEAMQDALTDSRARRVYRKGAVYGDEEGDEGSE